MARAAIQKIIEDKIRRIKEDPKESEKGDFLSILLADDLFKDDMEMMIDEALTFFLAGTQTTSITTTNLTLHAIQQPAIMKKIRAEIQG